MKYVWTPEGTFRITENELEKFYKVLPKEIQEIVFEHEVGIIFETTEKKRGKFRWARNLTIKDMDTLTEWVKSRKP
jgi:hypothetical protein